VLERRDAVAALRGALLLAAVSLCAPRGAAAQVLAEELRIQGAWPDINLSGGGGIGVGNSLDTNVFARLRLGGLYAYEPWVVNLGITGELGALAEHGAGAELELNHFGGPWLQVGGSRVHRAQWMGHLAFGFAVFGVEWQHRFGGDPTNAVLFLLRAPIGIWWFLMDDDNERRARQRRAREPVPDS
jgi:hypothetical protein